METVSATAEAVEAEAEVLPSSAPIEPAAMPYQEAKKLGPFELAAAMEAEVFTEAGDIMRDLMRAREWDPDDLVEQQAAFDAWVEAFGEERAKRIRRIARAAWANKKEAPVILENARSIYTNGVKARALTEAAPRTMNVQVVQMTAPLPNFQRKRIE